ncbi:gp436 family protein [Neptunomonas antarctica]|uniref:Mu-like prophage protein gp36 n=1 Tax=Neptunomonas antarctica TaxID=619304 RepID=A0A1N7MP42_9GAMM|nr:phage protein Gp36 family protein [Neptunomonas antarctica]SIS87914.1 Mu-like prophage protein gp36 [Neptunomonas antarctica]
MYCSTQDLTDRFGSDELITLTAVANAFGEFPEQVNQVQVDRAIADASATIDSYLAARYPLPLPQIPPVLNRFACDMARYFLHDRSPLEEVTARYKEAVRYLEKVAIGAITLGIDAQGQRPETMDGAFVTSAGSVFGRTDKGFI